MTYNYERFNMEHYDLKSFPGPKSGEYIGDFELTGLDGSVVRISDLRGKWLVIETGSLTCNLYSRNIKHMIRLMERHPDVEFIMLYVREAHAGSRLCQHKTMDDKRQSAEWLKRDMKETRTILLDDLDGTMHRHIGALPNVIYVIDPDGRVVYRRDWNLVKDLDEVLENRDTIHPDKHTTMADLNPMSLEANIDLFKTVLRGGWDALWDLFRAIPVFFIEHRKADKYFEKLDEQGHASTE